MFFVYNIHCFIPITYNKCMIGAHKYLLSMIMILKVQLYQCWWSKISHMICIFLTKDTYKHSNSLLLEYFSKGNNCACCLLFSHITLCPHPNDFCLFFIEYFLSWGCIFLFFPTFFFFFLFSGQIATACPFELLLCESESVQPSGEQRTEHLHLQSVCIDKWQSVIDIYVPW